MKRNILSSTLVALMFALAPSCSFGQERVVPMPNRQQLESVHVRVLFQDSEGYMWYGMKSDGLYRDDGYSLTSFRTDFRHPDWLMNNNVTALCEDNRNRIWIGTKRGLYILDKHDYSIRPTGDAKLQIWTFDALKVGQGDSVWAYANQHVLVYDGEGRCISQTQVEKNPLVTQDRRELTDQRGNFWQIDKDGIPSVTVHPKVRLEEVDLETLPLRFIVPISRSGLPREERVHTVWCADDSTKYVSTSMGVWMLKGDSKTGEPEQVGPNFGVVNTLSPGDDGTIYMNTEWQGLISYRNERIEKLDSTIRNAFDIFYHKEKLWICTSDGRLLLYDVQTKEKVDKSAECCLHGEAPIGIVVLKGKVWLLFNQRLLIYTPPKKTTEKPTIRYIYPSDFEPRPAFFRRLYTDGISRIFIECEQQSFELLMTCDSLKNKVPNKVAFSAYQTIHGTFSPGMDTHRIDLKADERVAHLFFTTFDHLNTQHIRFAYRHEGESVWQYLEMGKNDIRLTKIASGDQTIEVMATNAEGQWGKDIFTLTIHRNAHWWETPWAIAAYVLLALLLLGCSFWLGQKFRARRGISG